MINFRNIFNPSYSYIGLILIAILVFIIFLLQKDVKAFFKTIGTTSLIAGIITLTFALIIELIITSIVPYHYKIFIQVISNNLFRNLLYTSIFSIILGITIVTLSKINLKKTG